MMRTSLIEQPTPNKHLSGLLNRGCGRGMTASKARATLESLVRKCLLWLSRIPRYPKRTILATADFFLLGFALWLAMSLRLGEPYWPPSWKLLLVCSAAPTIGVATFFQLGLYRLVTR